MTEYVKKINTVLAQSRVDCAGRDFSVGHYSGALAAYRIVNLYAHFATRSEWHPGLHAASGGAYVVPALAGHHTGISVGSTHFTMVIQFIILPFIAEFTRLLNNLPVLMSQLIVLWQDITSGEWLKLPPQIDAIVMTTLARISSYGVELAQRGIFAIFSLATTVLECLLVPIMTFYLLKDGRQIKG